MYGLNRDSLERVHDVNSRLAPSGSDTFVTLPTQTTRFTDRAKLETTRLHLVYLGFLVAIYEVRHASAATLEIAQVPCRLPG